MPSAALPLFVLWTQKPLNALNIFAPYRGGGHPLISICLSAVRRKREEQKKFVSLQAMNLKVTHAMMSMIAENFSPAVALASPIWPATRPEKNPMIIAAWENRRL